MTRKTYYRYIILLVLTVLASAGSSETNAQVKIHGKVTDANGEAIEFATVRIGGTAIGTTTGLEGEYSLSCARADTITVHFSCIGYRDEKRTLIDPQGDVTLNMRLQLNNETLQQVEITELKKQTGSMATIDASSLKRSPDVSGGSVESLLTTMAGVTGSNEMSSQYSVRGGSYDENSVYINGIEVYRPQLISSGQQEGLSVINPDLVDRISFSTGGFPAEYGDRMSSVLDITYRSPESFEGSVTGSLMGASIAIGQGSRRFSQLHGLRYKTTSSLLSSMDTKGEYDPRYFDYQTSLSFRASQRLSVSFLGNVSINDYRFKPADRNTTFGTVEDAHEFKVFFDGREKDKFETWIGALSVAYQPTRATRLQLTASGFLTNELVSYDISGEYWLDQAGAGDIGGELGVGRYHEHARQRLKGSVMGVSLRGETALSSTNTLTYGASLRHESIMDRSREWELRDSAGYSLPADPDRLSMIYSLDSHHDISSSRMEAYVQDTWHRNTSAGLVTLNAGLRLSHWSFNKETLVSPRVSVGFIPESRPSWALRFATGLYYQSPFYKEYRRATVDADGNNVIELNREIKSPQSIHFIAGSDYTFRAFSRPFKFSAELYYKLLSRLVPYELDNLRLVYSGENQASGSAAGLDMKLFGQFVPGSDSWISFSLMKSTEKMGGKSVPLPTDRTYSFSLYFTDFFPRIPRLKFSLRAIFMQGLPATPPHSSRYDGYFRMPPYKRVDVGVQYALLPPLGEGQTRGGIGKVLKSVWIGADVFNLLDITNVASYYWVTDVNSIRYAVPNYLTRRQINLRLAIDF